MDRRLRCSLCGSHGPLTWHITVSGQDGPVSSWRADSVRCACLMAFALRGMWPGYRVAAARPGRRALVAGGAGGWS